MVAAMTVTFTVFSSCSSPFVCQAMAEVTEMNMRRETMPYLRTENENLDEIRYRVLSANLELISARMGANVEKRKYEQTIQRLFQLLKIACQERDEARDKLQLLLRKFQQPMVAETRTSISQARAQDSVLCTKESKALTCRSCDLSLASCQTRDGHSSMGFSHARIVDSSNCTFPKQRSHESRTGKNKEEIFPSRDITVDRASMVIDKKVWGKPLPQKGRLLRTVTEAGPLLQTLLVPSPSSSSCIPTKRTHDSFSAKINDRASETTSASVPTCLSLAFPGNSHIPSQKSSSASGSAGLPVKKKQMLCLDTELDMTPKQKLTGKKRKLL
ncbi:hypothetical protein L6164_033565 [Bauhinia variegata]|uniref:Uncharacterized protein n=1 Tax=Bauhinia variegata TaxID=167791 RepID=A0ACB9KSB2_BAUVA|nr:hypothetical protein L6164_033565 [Bauhinia variegata]